MKEEIIKFIKENNLSLFEKNFAKTPAYTILKTKDARDIQTRLLELISEYFIFDDTKQILKFFVFPNSIEEIKKRQNFFKLLTKQDNSILKNLKREPCFWRPKYDVIVATENEGTLIQLQKLNCPVVFINSESDLAGLDKYDLVQIIDCDNFYLALERLPQAIFLDSINEVFLERFLTQLSGWKNNLEILKNTEGEIKEIVEKLSTLLPLIDSKKEKNISLPEIEKAIEDANKIIFEKIKKMTLSGESVVSLISRGIPPEIKQIINEEIKKTEMPEELFEFSIPIKIDEKETENFLKRQSSQEFTNSAAIIKKHSQKIREIPVLIEKLKEEIIYLDFIAGMSNFISSSDSFPEISEELFIENSKNVFLENAQPISFKLDENYSCSILTGANSGGKTTLIEHIIQLILLSFMGLPISGNLKIPLFKEIFYFAKNKGMASKGAFETLLTQMASISPTEKTLILADEIEAVTEPGVAGKIISASAEYFLSKKCFLIIATHLGYEVQKILPAKARIDGIEAKGLDKNFNLIVDHNPVLGRLAHSTPELIVEKMASSQNSDYLKFVNSKMKETK